MTTSLSLADALRITRRIVDYQQVSITDELQLAAWVARVVPAIERLRGMHEFWSHVWMEPDVRHAIDALLAAAGTEEP